MCVAIVRYQTFGKVVIAERENEGSGLWNTLQTKMVQMDAMVYAPGAGQTGIHV